MSLINQMLKDLEKRRSRDLETSDSLSQNITWETAPNQRHFNWMAFTIIVTLTALLAVIVFLLWERTEQKPEHNISVHTKSTSAAKNNQAQSVKKAQPVKKTVVKKEIKKSPAKTVVAENDFSEAIDIEKAVDVEEMSDEIEVDNSEVIQLQKKSRPLNSKQLAEIAYNKGYQYLQQGRMRQGKEFLREALSLYIPHVKAREMLAGIYIKSGRLIDAAELLSEGVKVAPEYSLFAKLYARVLLEQNNPKLAIKILENGSAAMDVEPDYFALLAATYQRINNHEKATDLYLQLVKLKPNAGVWWLGLAISLEKSGKTKEALEAYQRAQNTGSLKSGLIKFTNNKVSALSEIGFPE